MGKSWVECGSQVEFVQTHAVNWKIIRWAYLWILRTLVEGIAFKHVYLNLINLNMIKLNGKNVLLSIE